MNEKYLDRFWKQVEKRGPKECWKWTGSRKPHGYGQIMIAGKMKRAHRVSWEIMTGTPPPSDMAVCHECDNPPCVNPAHLRLGTQKQNIHEARSKGRLYNHYRGRTHCSNGHEYTDATVVMILKNGSYYRACRTCYAERKRRYRVTKRLAQDIHPNPPDE